MRERSANFLYNKLAETIRATLSAILKLRICCKLSTIRSLLSPVRAILIIVSEVPVYSMVLDYNKGRIVV
jgi:hypothetical protein